MNRDKESILIIDDSLDDRRLIKHHLNREGYQLSEAKNGKEALEKVASEKPDLILLDIVMPGMDGFEVCKKIRENPKLKALYIIMLTAEARENDHKVSGLDGGADHYMLKPFDADELKARIRTGLRTAAEKKGAIIDPLTQLYNRFFFNTLLEQEVARARRFNHSLSLIMLDLDFFKKVNDTFGHYAGDTVLTELAEILQQHSRETDLPIRWGGEEFVLLLPETDIGGAARLAEKIRVAVKDYRFTEAGSLTASLGVATLCNQEDQGDLLKRVDDALYEAKGGGRNQIKVA